MTEINREYGQIVAITNRHLCNGDFLKQIEYLCQNGISRIILREKDMSETEYMELSEKVLAITDRYNVQCILHTYIDVAIKLNHLYIHLPMHGFISNVHRLENFKIKGVSTHTVDEAKKAESLKASYITASHIYETDCKKGLEPKGVRYLKEVCDSINTPVYALGGINFENMYDTLNMGADKVCMMSELMKADI